MLNTDLTMAAMNRHRFKAKANKTASYNGTASRFLKSEENADYASPCLYLLSSGAHTEGRDEGV